MIKTPKRCSRCKVVKSRKQYRVRTSTLPSGTLTTASHPWCRKCEREASLLRSKRYQ